MVTVVDVSAVGGIAGAVLIEDVESVVDDVDVLLPQEETISPKASAKILILFVFMIIVLPLFDQVQ